MRNGQSAGKGENMVKNCCLLDKYKEQVIADYLTNQYSLADLGNRYNVSRQTVTNYLKRMQVYNPGPIKYAKRIYDLNINFFTEVSTEHQAYWLGFIAADGNVSKDLRSISIELHEKDEEILEQFRHDVSSNEPIVYTCNNKKKIRVNSKLLCQKIGAFGIVPNKTLTFSFNWDLLEAPLIRHFIRGYFDGDGSIWQQTRDNVWGINFTGSKTFMRELLEYLPVQMSYTDKGSVASISTQAQQKIIDMYYFLYTDATIFLTRKDNRFLQALNDYQGQPQG